MGKIYTRTGDKGTTGLYGGKRINKNSLRIETIGNVDELNSAIGLVIAQNQISKIKSKKYNSKLKTELIKIQEDLFEIGAVLATPEKIRVKEKKIHQQFSVHLGKRVTDFEKLIDILTKEIPAMKSFILPGGGVAGANLHLARSITRRAERAVVALSQKEFVYNQIMIYMNRLSDILFTMARFVNFKEKKKDTPWKGLK